jgi:hypothetical protein
VTVKYKTVVAEVQTTNNTTTTLWEDTAGTIGAYHIIVTAAQTGGSRVDYQSWVIHAHHYTTFTPTQLITQFEISQIGSAPAATWVAVCDLNGANLRIRVTGAAATNIDWKASITTLSA